MCCCSCSHCCRVVMGGLFGCYMHHSLIFFVILKDAKIRNGTFSRQLITSTSHPAVSELWNKISSLTSVALRHRIIRTRKSKGLRSVLSKPSHFHSCMPANIGQTIWNQDRCKKRARIHLRIQFGVSPLADFCIGLRYSV